MVPVRELPAVITPLLQPPSKQQHKLGLKTAREAEEESTTSGRSRSRSPRRGAESTADSDDSPCRELDKVYDEKARLDNSTMLTLDFRTPVEWLSFFVGLLIVLVCAVPVGGVILSAMIWEALDRGWDGGLVDSGKELSGFLCARAVPAFNCFTQKFNERFVKKREDAYMVNTMLLYGVLIPSLFFACAWRVHQVRSVELWLVYVYHVLRIGPFFMNFAFVYALCHKEGHARVGLFAAPYNNFTIFRCWFNWWAGMFYGVLPASFAYGHTINHHKYNNGPLDVVTTADKPRDSLVNFIAFLPRWFLYACNFSCIIQFASEGNFNVVFKVIWGTVYFLIWLGIWAHYLGWYFAMAYLVFPFLEAGILLAAVNWSWHSMIDPEDPENEFVQALTLLDGPVNVLNEDAHVVHHQYPGAHWTDHPGLVEKHWQSYDGFRGSVFRHTHTFEVFGMSIARDYDKLAEKFVDLYGERTGNPLSFEQRKDLIKARLRACWWGPRADPKWAQLMSRRVDPKSALKCKTQKWK